MAIYCVRSCFVSFSFGAGHLRRSDKYRVNATSIWSGAVAVSETRFSHNSQRAKFRWWAKRAMFMWWPRKVRAKQVNFRFWLGVRTGMATEAGKRKLTRARRDERVIVVQKIEKSRVSFSETNNSTQKRRERGRWNRFPVSLSQAKLQRRRTWILILICWITF